MKTALLALFFLLFRFCTQLLTTAEVVLDVHDNPVRPGEPYHIRDATNYDHAISLDEIGNQTCPISVVLAIDPKRVIFHTIQDPEAENITTEEPLNIEFSWVHECAKSPKWRVLADAFAVYPLLVGPPDKRHIPGRFQIKKAQDESDAYNLVFKLYGIDEHVVATRTYNDREDLSVLKLCSEEGLKVNFYPVGGYPVDSVRLMRKRIIK